MAAMEWIYNGRLSELKGSTQRVFKGDTIFHDDESISANAKAVRLEEFRAMALEEGSRGRKAHRAAEVPKYEHEKHAARPSRWRSNGEHYHT